MFPRSISFRLFSSVSFTWDIKSIVRGYHGTRLYHEPALIVFNSTQSKLTLPKDRTLPYSLTYNHLR